jgi:hypothetical protein
MMFVDIVDRHIEPLRDGLAGNRRPDQILYSVSGVAEHDHAVAEHKLGMGDTVTVALDHHLGLEAEGLAQPIDGGPGIAIAQSRNDPASLAGRSSF